MLSKGSIQRASLPLAFAAASLLIASCGKKQVVEKSVNPPLAIVGGEAILPADLTAEIAWRRTNNHFVPAPEVMLDEMVNRLATVQRAKKSGLDKDYDTKRRMESQLIARLRETQIDQQIQQITVTDEDVEKAYQERIGEYTRKALDRYAILFQEASSKSSDAKKQEARKNLTEALERLKADPNQGGRGPAANGFGILSVDFSEEQSSRHRGGDIGWIEAGATNTRWPKSLLDAGSKLENGAVSEIIETEDGFYVIRKTDSRPGGARPLAEVSDQLRQNLTRERRETIEKTFVAESYKAANPKIDHAVLKSMNLPQVTPPNRSPENDQPPGFPGVSTTR